jgi:transporter family protein
LACGLSGHYGWLLDFYYNAIKLGDVSTVVLIAKGSVVIALLLSFWILHETMTTVKLIGAAMIVDGFLVIARG